MRHAELVRERMLAGKDPSVVVELNGARPVTWVHLLQGQWLLTATSDSSLSELSLFSLRDILSTRLGDRKPTPIATAFLEGPVADGLAEVRDGRVVIAIEIRSP